MALYDLWMSPRSAGAEDDESSANPSGAQPPQPIRRVSRISDAVNAARVPAGDAGPGQIGTANSTAQQPVRLAGNTALAKDPTPEPFLDDSGSPVTRADGTPVMKPKGVDMRFFVNRGFTDGGAGSLAVLPSRLNFPHGGD